MKTIKRNELTTEMIEKAMACQTADELLALAKHEGIEMTKDEAEAYMAELSDFELDEAALTNAAGGGCWTVNDKGTMCNEKCIGVDDGKRIM